MNRQELSIADLKNNIKYDWRAVCAAFDEDDNGEGIDVVLVDLICEWRLPDGGVKFVKVPFNSPEELAEIKAVLQASVATFTKVLKVLTSLEK